MSAILNGLNQGHSPQQILAYLTKAFPALRGSIQKATKTGYTPHQILGFLSKSFEEDHTGMSESAIHASTRRSDAARVKHGLKLAGSAVALPIAGIAARNALSRALPSSVQQGITGAAVQGVAQPVGGQQPPVSNNPLNQNAANPLNTASAPTLQTNPVQTNQTTSQNAPNSLLNNNNITNNELNNQTKQIINKPEYVTALDMLGIRERLERLRLQGKSPEIIKAAAKKMVTADQLKELEQNGPGYFDNLIDTFIREEPTMQVLNKETKQPVDVKPLDMEEERPIEKGQDVITPSGVGKVVANRNGKAIVEIDGKKQQIDEDELETSPINEKDLADLYEELIGGIEKETGEDVSRMTSWAGYDPKKNSLAFMPHGGGIYIYEDITPEDASLLTSVLNTRKTSGENFIGAWKAGSKSPIGAAMSALIKKLQSERGGKGNEYSGKFETLYNYLEPAIQAKKKKKKKKKS